MATEKGLRRAERKAAAKAAKAAKARRADRALRQADPEHYRETSIEGPAVEFTESPRGYKARGRWAKRYDKLNGAPESSWDR